MEPPCSSLRRAVPGRLRSRRRKPVAQKLDQVPDAARKTVVDLGCGTGPLLPYLAGRFGRVIALDFAPAMIDHARRRLGADAERVTFLTRAMHELDDLAGAVDVAVAVNSVVMPDVRVIDRTLRAIRASLRHGGLFLGVVPAMDAIHYHTMLLMDTALDRGQSPEEAERSAAFHAEHHFYDFQLRPVLVPGTPAEVLATVRDSPPHDQGGVCLGRTRSCALSLG